MSRRLAAVLGFVWILLAGAVQAEGEGTDVEERSGAILVIELDGAINAASADYITGTIDRGEESGAAAVILEMDTPGGVLPDTKNIIQRMLSAEVPVVVFIRPRGAWAGSAGAMITIAGHVAAMSPRATIGAAHPVFSGTENPKGEKNEDGTTEPTDYLMEKVENITAAYMAAVAEERGRNAEWAESAVRESVAASAEEALELNVIDLIAEDRADLIAQLDGREVSLQGRVVILRTAGMPVEEIAMDPLVRFFFTISSPEILSILMLIGMAGLYFEYNNPGGIIPGAIGLVCITLGLIAGQTIPLSAAGLVLVAVGIGLMAVEAFFPAYGVLVLLGAAMLLVGGSMVFDRPDVSNLNINFWSFLVPLVGTFTACMFAIVVAMGRTRSIRQVAGVHELVGLRGVTKSALSPEGTVFLRGEHWKAIANESVPEGTRVEAVAVDGLRLEVKRVQD